MVICCHEKSSSRNVLTALVKSEIICFNSVIWYNTAESDKLQLLIGCEHSIKVSEGFTCEKQAYWSYILLNRYIGQDRNSSVLSSSFGLALCHLCDF